MLLGADTARVWLQNGQNLPPISREKLRWPKWMPLKTNNLVRDSESEDIPPSNSSQEAKKTTAQQWTTTANVTPPLWLSGHARRLKT